MRLNKLVQGRGPTAKGPVIGQRSGAVIKAGSMLLNWGRGRGLKYQIWIPFLKLKQKQNVLSHPQKKAGFFFYVSSSSCFQGLIQQTLSAKCKYACKPSGETTFSHQHLQQNSLALGWYLPTGRYTHSWLVYGGEFLPKADCRRRLGCPRMLSSEDWMSTRNYLTNTSYDKRLELQHVKAEHSQWLIRFLLESSLVRFKSFSFLEKEKYNDPSN